MISDNFIRCGTDSASGLNPNQDGIVAVDVNNTIIRNNAVFGGRIGIIVADADRVTVDGNLITGGAGSNAIDIASDAKDCVVCNNVSVNGNRNYLVANKGFRTVVSNNHINNDSGNGRCVQANASAVGSQYFNNSSDSGPTVLGTRTDQYFGAHRNTGNDISTVPGIIFTDDIPSTDNPNIRHNRGDISFKITASAGGKVGWVCTSGGIPGTWKPFGVIDA